MSERDPFLPLSAKVNVTKTYSVGGREQTPSQSRMGQAKSIAARITSRVLPMHPKRKLPK